MPQFVDLSGVPRRTIQDIELRNNSRLSTAIKLANTLNVSIDELRRKTQ